MAVPGCELLTCELALPPSGATPGVDQPGGLLRPPPFPRPTPAVKRDCPTPTWWQLRTLFKYRSARNFKLGEFYGEGCFVVLRWVPWRDLLGAVGGAGLALWVRRVLVVDGTRSWSLRTSVTRRAE